MAVGLHSVNLADKWLNMLSATAFTAPTNTYVKLHTADPGSAATTAPSGTTTRVILSWAASASGVKAITATLPSWSSWAGGSETISHCSVWDNLTVGSVLYTFALTTPKAITNGDQLNLTSHSISLSPVMA